MFQSAGLFLPVCKLPDSVARMITRQLALGLLQGSMLAGAIAGTHSIGHCVEFGSGAYTRGDLQSFVGPLQLLYLWSVISFSGTVSAVSGVSMTTVNQGGKRMRCTNALYSREIKKAIYQRLSLVPTCLPVKYPKSLSRSINTCMRGLTVLGVFSLSLISKIPAQPKSEHV